MWPWAKCLTAPRLSLLNIETNPLLTVLPGRWHESLRIVPVFEDLVHRALVAISSVFSWLRTFSALDGLTLRPCYAAGSFRGPLWEASEGHPSYQWGPPPTTTPTPSRSQCLQNMGGSDSFLGASFQILHKISSTKLEFLGALMTDPFLSSRGNSTEISALLIYTYYYLLLLF